MRYSQRIEKIEDRLRTKNGYSNIIPDLTDEERHLLKQVAGDFGKWLLGHEDPDSVPHDETMGVIKIIAQKVLAENPAFQPPVDIDTAQCSDTFGGGSIEGSCS